MMLPNESGGATTEQVGYFDVETASLVEWLVQGFEGDWRGRQGIFSLPEDAVAALEASAVLTRYLCVPVGTWTALLSNGPLGTDVGLLPSFASRELGCQALRAVAVSDESLYPARILEVFGPAGAAPLGLERSIVAANDGGHWVFERAGTPYPFEDESAYVRPLRANRFTAAMLYDYVRALGVPIDSAPEWDSAVLLELQ